MHVLSLPPSLFASCPPPPYSFSVGVFSAGAAFWIDILGLACLAPCHPPTSRPQGLHKRLVSQISPQRQQAPEEESQPRHREARDGKGFPRSSGELPPGKARSRPVPLQGQAAEHRAPAVPAWSLTVLITHRRLEALPAHCPLSQHHSSASHAPPVYTGSPGCHLPLLMAGSKLVFFIGCFSEWDGSHLIPFDGRAGKKYGMMAQTYNSGTSEASYLKSRGLRPAGVAERPGFETRRRHASCSECGHSLAVGSWMFTTV